MVERGALIKSNTITMNFDKARDKAGFEWGEGTSATFHERCYLAER